MGRQRRGADKTRVSRLAQRRPAMPKRARGVAAWIGGALGIAFALSLLRVSRRCQTCARWRHPIPRPRRSWTSANDEAHDSGKPARTRCSAGSATTGSRRTSSARCWWRKTRRSGSTRASTSRSCRNRSKSTGRAASSSAVRAPSRSSWPRTSICRRRAVPSASCASSSSRGGSKPSCKKSRILEIYLNVIEWGDGIYGVEAASRAYFNAPASALGPDESALLAGGDRQSATAESGEADAAPAETPAADPPAHGRRVAAGRDGGGEACDADANTLRSQLDTRATSPIYSCVLRILT